jgi:hypothetical protein
MEDQTRNDLEACLQQWRHQYEAQETFSTTQMEELESHLRESARSLVSPGLTEEEAFLIATRRLGQPTTLAKQFQTKGESAWWTRRLLWMLGGIVAYNALETIQGLFQVIPYLFLGHTPEAARVVVLKTRIAVALCSAVFLWLALRQQGDLTRRALQKIPVRWWLVLLPALISVRPIALMVGWSSSHGYSPLYNWECASQLANQLWLIGLMALFFIVWRRARAEAFPTPQHSDS